MDILVCHDCLQVPPIGVSKVKNLYSEVLREVFANLDEDKVCSLVGADLRAQPQTPASSNGGVPPTPYRSGFLPFIPILRIQHYLRGPSRPTPRVGSVRACCWVESVGKRLVRPPTRLHTHEELRRRPSSPGSPLSFLLVVFYDSSSSARPVCSSGTAVEPRPRTTPNQTCRLYRSV